MAQLRAMPGRRRSDGGRDGRSTMHDSGEQGVADIAVRGQAAQFLVIRGSKPAGHTRVGC